MIPCKDAGLPFKNGDVLQIVEQDDPNWWQVSVLKLLSLGEMFKK